MDLVKSGFDLKAAPIAVLAAVKVPAVTNPPTAPKTSTASL